MGRRRSGRRPKKSLSAAAAAPQRRSAQIVEGRSGGAGPDRREALARLAEKYAVPIGDLDGWTIAVNLTRSDRRIFNRELQVYAERLAARAVLRRAADLVGPIRGATERVREPLRDPFSGEFDLERTLENIGAKELPEPEDWVVERRQERRQQVVLMVDTSLSMSGENMAMAAVAAAVLALKLHRGDLSVVVFEDQARAVSHLEQEAPPALVVERMLEQPVRGYTNIEAALRVGAEELARGRNPRKAGLLVTDGVSTAGGDPLPLAARFNRLFVLLTEDYKMNPGLCRQMADLGHGDVFPVKSFAQLPRRMLDVADRVLR